MTSQRDQAIKERNALETERDKLAAENASLGDEICSERQLGFDQGIAQCHYFFQTPLTHPDFDIMKVYVDGNLVDLSSQLVPDPDPPANITGVEVNVTAIPTDPPAPTEPPVTSTDPSPDNA